MNDKVKGFVLSSIDYKENDVLLRVVTKEYGILSLVAKSSKKLTSKNHFLNMCIYEFIIDYIDNKTMFSIHNAKLVNNYFDDKDIIMMAFKNLLCEACLKNEDISTFDEIEFIFSHLNNQNKYLLGCLFFSYLMKQFGISPNVDSCTVCKNLKVVSISNRFGGFVCLNHLNGEKPLEVERLKKFRLIVKASFNNYDVVSQFNYDINDFKSIADFYIENADIHLKSYDFYLSLC